MAGLFATVKTSQVADRIYLPCEEKRGRKIVKFSPAMPGVVLKFFVGSMDYQGLLLFCQGYASAVSRAMPIRRQHFLPDKIMIKPFTSSAIAPASAPYSVASSAIIVSGVFFSLRRSMISAPVELATKPSLLMFQDHRPIFLSVPEHAFKFHRFLLQDKTRRRLINACTLKTLCRSLRGR